MILCENLTELETRILEYSAAQIGASGGITINPDSVEIEDSIVKDLLSFITWDYLTHTIYETYLRGKLAEAKYQCATKAGCELNRKIRKSI